MSGICGIVHLDGAPADRASIRSMTDFLAYRGPDAREIWIEGCAALGHAMLRTTPEDDSAHLPCSLDGSVWITADARIDGQEDLKGKLRAAGREGVDEASDAELVLHAYHAWGEDCPKHLIGDFAFAIWDAPLRRLFFARDHFGVKPFFYARVGECVVFSNTLDCVRSHPAISGVLDDLAIADFLLFDGSQDPESTAFADIRRLPPAHFLTFSPGAQKPAPVCYWTFPPAEVRYRPSGDYVQRFRELLEIAIADRLRTRRVGLSMSGGLDSTSIAAVAKGLLARGALPFELKAFTVVFDRIIPDEERHYAGLAAHWIGIPIHYCAGDDYRLYQEFGAAKTPHPEPFHEPEGGVFREFLEAQVAHARVALTGWDGDALLNESPKPYIRALLKERRYGRMMRALVGYAISERRVVPLAWRRHAGKLVPADASQFPAWIHPALERKLRLRERWESAQAGEAQSDPIRPYAQRIFRYVARQSNFFERYDAGVTRMPLECRHPLLDLRLIRYCLSLPPQPWCVKKWILRAAMRDLLPDQIRMRPKTALAGYSGMKMLERPDAQWIDRFEATPGLRTYVERQSIPKIGASVDPDRTWRDLRPLTLNFWLQNLVHPPPTPPGPTHEHS